MTCVRIAIRVLGGVGEGGVGGRRGDCWLVGSGNGWGERRRSGWWVGGEDRMWLNCFRDLSINKLCLSLTRSMNKPCTAKLPDRFHVLVEEDAS